MKAPAVGLEKPKQRWGKGGAKTLQESGHPWFVPISWVQCDPILKTRRKCASDNAHWSFGKPNHWKALCTARCEIVLKHLRKSAVTPAMCRKNVWASSINICCRRAASAGPRPAKKPDISGGKYSAICLRSWMQTTDAHNLYNCGKTVIEKIQQGWASFGSWGLVPSMTTWTKREIRVESSQLYF